MEIVISSFIGTGKAELSVHSLFIDPYSHGRDFKRASQHIVPENYIAVELPVIVVGRSAVVLLARFKLSADFLDEYGSLFLRNEILSLFRSLVRPSVFVAAASSFRPVNVWFVGERVG